MRHSVLVLAVVIRSATPCAAQTPALVKDINDIRATDASDFIAMGDAVFFVADDVATGRELWKLPSGGTAASLLKDIWPGAGSASPSHLTLQNGVLFFSANDGVHGRELWRSDGTAAGTSMVRDIAPGAADSDPASLVDVYASLLYFWRWRGSLFFTANDGEHGRELWRSDGTPEGTALVKDIVPGSQDSNLESLVNLNGVLFASTPVQLWKSDGTDQGTVALKPSGATGGAESHFAAQHLTVAGGRLYFVANDGKAGVEVWRTDGTPSGTVPVADLSPGPASSNPLGLVGGKSRLFFTATGKRGRALFMSDGSERGTTPLTPPNATVRAGEIAIAGDSVFFAATDQTRGTELWRVGADGSRPSLVADIQKGPPSSEPTHLTGLGHLVYFSARTGEEGAELWRSDGTPKGTSMVADLEPGRASCSPDGLSGVGTRLFFSCQVPRGNSGPMVSRPSLRGPWVSDGAGGVPVRVTGPSGRTGDSRPVPGIRTSTGFYFSAVTVEGRAIWRTDGSTGQAIKLLTLPAETSGSPIVFARLGDRVFFFVGSNSGGDLDWYTSDGSAAGTVRVLQARIFREIRDVVTVGNRMVFWAYTPETGTEVWASDGTSTGTVVLKDLAPGRDSSRRTALVATGSLVYFGAAVENKGTTLWRTDGTPTGTRPVGPTGTGKDTFVSGEVAAIGEAVVHVDEKWPNSEVRRTSGRSSVLIRRGEGSWRHPEHLTSHQSAVYFDDEESLWRVNDRSDRAELVGNLGRGSHVMAMASSAAHLFMLIDGEGGRAVWASDGSGETTRMVKHVELDHSFTPGEFVVVGNSVFFPASDGSGIELWTSDGTPEGTHRVADLAPGPPSSEPTNLFEFGNALFFSADDGRTGRELWKFEPNGAGGANRPATPGVK